jgi:hypothetical protein
MVGMVGIMPSVQPEVSEIGLLAGNRRASLPDCLRAFFSVGEAAIAGDG